MSSRVDSGNRRRISATQAIPTISIFPFSRSLSIRFPFNYRIFVFILIFIRRTSNPWKGDSIRNYTKISFQSKAKNQIFFHNRVVYRCFTRTNEARKKRIIINVKNGLLVPSEWPDSTISSRFSIPPLLFFRPHFPLPLSSLETNTLFFEHLANIPTPESSVKHGRNRTSDFRAMLVDTLIHDEFARPAIWHSSSNASRDCTSDDLSRDTCPSRDRGVGKILGGSPGLNRIAVALYFGGRGNGINCFARIIFPLCWNVYFFALLDFLKKRKKYEKITKRNDSNTGVKRCSNEVLNWDKRKRKTIILLEES